MRSDSGGDKGGKAASDNGGDKGGKGAGGNGGGGTGEGQGAPEGRGAPQAPQPRPRPQPPPPVPLRVWMALLAAGASAPLHALAAFSAHHGAAGFPRGPGALALSHHGAKGFHHQHNPFLGHHHHLHGPGAEWSLGHLAASHHGGLAHAAASALFALALWLFFVGNPLRRGAPPGGAPPGGAPSAPADAQDALVVRHAHALLGAALVLGYLPLAAAAHGALNEDPAGPARLAALFLALGFAGSLGAAATRGASGGPGR